MNATCRALPLTYRAPRWMRDALCGEIGPEMYFADYTTGQTPHERWLEQLTVQRVCINCCPVRTACLDWALRNDLEYGIFGGLTARQRQRLRGGERVYVTLNPEISRRAPAKKAAEVAA